MIKMACINKVKAFPFLILLTASLLLVLGGTAHAVSDKSLIQLSGDTKVYWLQNSKIYHVYDAATLDSMQAAGIPGWSWSSITLVGSLSGYTVGPEFAPTTTASNGLLIQRYPKSTYPDVYRVYNIKKGKVSYDPCQENNCWNDIIEVAQSILDKFSTAADPTISSISPTTTSPGTFNLTINGSGFDASNATDKVYTSGGSYVGSGISSGNLVSRSSTQIVVKETITDTGSYIVKVENPDYWQRTDGKTLTITNSPPSVTTTSATNVTSTSATINGTITTDGGSSIIERRFDWGTTPDGTGWTDWTSNVTVSGNNYSYSLTNLNSGTTYYFRAWAKNSVGWGNGSILSFATTSINPTIAQTPESVSQGQQYSQWGTGFSTSSTATLYFKDPSGTQTTKSQSISSTGDFSNTYTMSTSQTTGTYTWWAVDGPTGKQSNTVTYTVVASTAVNPTIAQTPESVSQGQQYSQWGTGFSTSSTATLYFKDPSGTQTSKSQSISSTGDFSNTYTMSTSQTTGTYTWWAVDGPTGKQSNTVTYTVVASTAVNPTIAQTPESVSQGQQYSQWGTGFSKSSTATLYFKDPSGTQTSKSQSITPTGDFSNTYTMSTSQPTGTYTWWAVDGPTGKQSNTVTYTVLSNISSPTLIQKSGDYKVYYVSGTTKRHIPDPETFEILFGVNGWDTITKNLSETEFNNYTTGTPIPLLRTGLAKDGSLVQPDGDIKVYLLETDTTQNKVVARHIPDPETLYAMGRTFNEVIQLDAALFNRIEIGSAIPAVCSGSRDSSFIDYMNSFGNNGASAYDSGVNTAIGNYTHSQTLLSMPGRGLPFVFTATYNAMAGYNSNGSESYLMGPGWRHSYNIEAYETVKNGVNKYLRIKWGDGHEEFYEWDGTAYKAAGVYNTVTGGGTSGKLTLITKDQIKYEFSTSGTPSNPPDNNSCGETVTITQNRYTLDSISDRNDNKITVSAVTRTTGTPTSTITDTVGRVITLTYADMVLESGLYVMRLSKVSDQAGRTVEFSYDADTGGNAAGEGNLLKIKDLNGGMTTFTYKKVQGLTTPLIETITDPRNNPYVSNSYKGSIAGFDYKSLDTINTGGLGSKAFGYDSSTNETTVTASGIANKYKKD